MFADPRPAAPSRAPRRTRSCHTHSGAVKRERVTLPSTDSSNQFPPLYSGVATVCSALCDCVQFALQQPTLRTHRSYVILCGPEAPCSPRGGPRVRPARAAYGDRAGSWLRERWKSPYVEMDRYSCTGRYSTGWLRRMHSEGVMPTRDSAAALGNGT